MTTTSYVGNVFAASTDAPIAGSLLNALANGAYALGASSVTNTPTFGTTPSYDLADLWIYLASAVTTGSGTPNIVVTVLPSDDNTNFPAPPASTAGAAPIYLGQTYQQQPGISTSVLFCPAINVAYQYYKVEVQNNLGVAFPSTGNTLIMRRKGVAIYT